MTSTPVRAAVWCRPWRSFDDRHLIELVIANARSMLEVVEELGNRPGRPSRAR